MAFASYCVDIFLVFMYEKNRLDDLFIEASFLRPLVKGFTRGFLLVRPAVD